jgi:hypothetical protein
MVHALEWGAIDYPRGLAPDAGANIASGMWTLSSNLSAVAHGDSFPKYNQRKAAITPTTSEMSDIAITLRRLNRRWAEIPGLARLFFRCHLPSVHS